VSGGENPTRKYGVWGTRCGGYRASAWLKPRTYTNCGASWGGVVVIGFLVSSVGVNLGSRLWGSNLER
jgi:hypothetical protein